MSHPMSFRIQNEEYLDKASNNQLRMLMGYFYKRLENDYEVNEVNAIVPLDPISDPKGLSILASVYRHEAAPPISASEMKGIVKETIGHNARLASVEDVGDGDWEVMVGLPINVKISIGNLNESQ